MPILDPLQENINGARQLVGASTNKSSMNPQSEDGVIGDFEDVVTLNIEDSELLLMSRRWEASAETYVAPIREKAKWNKKYLLGRQMEGNAMRDVVVPSNLLFEATATFIPAALAKNPTPVVYPASNDPMGMQISKDVKTMLQYHADVQVLKRKLGQSIWNWSIDYLGVFKHGWDSKVSDITLDVKNTKNILLDKDGVIDVYGNFTGKYLIEKRKSTAQELVDTFSDDSNPESSLSADKKAYITASVDGQMGTSVAFKEIWTNEMCFYVYEGIILDKHKNPFWNYEGNNHFGRMKMPYTFLSVFSFEDQPHDFTNLIEQNIPNQDIVNKRIAQIDRNLDNSNNSLVVSATNFTQETAKQAADAIQEGRPIIAPEGKPIAEAIMRLPAPSLPADAFNQLNDMSGRLRSIYGTTGISPEGIEQDPTVRGKILATQQDNSRIGGGIGESLEQVADNIFNWWVQLYYVFYDENHFAAILGQSQAVQYIELRSADLSQRIVVSVAPNSMKPKDEITEMNQAIDLWNAKALDPLTLFERLNDPDPQSTAERVVLWTTNPQMYAAKYFPDTQPAQAPNQGAMQEQGVPQAGSDSLSENAPSASLSTVPISMAAMPK